MNGYAVSSGERSDGALPRVGSRVGVLSRDKSSGWRDGDTACVGGGPTE